MENMNYSINKEEQISKIVEDTEEIIKNFRIISELISTKIETNNDPIYNLGKRIINLREDSTDTCSSFGKNQINLLQGHLF